MLVGYWPTSSFWGVGQFICLGYRCFLIGKWSGNVLCENLLDQVVFISALSYRRTGRSALRSRCGRGRNVDARRGYVECGALLQGGLLRWIIGHQPCRDRLGMLSREMLSCVVRDNYRIVGRVRCLARQSNGAECGCGIVCRTAHILSWPLCGGHIFLYAPHIRQGG